ncbi:sensor domain-containing diguanylate cyclase [Senegalia massiliensis]|uniref:sensor domain-containing diguanylate cyclase n=1 Tax=Senegalia massiliensis TaxID=1720316 RepID=UPI0013EEEDF0|nr:sensor domain-containing diguanylate cyclase [Senegalia massiliensis]
MSKRANKILFQFKLAIILIISIYLPHILFNEMDALIQIIIIFILFNILNSKFFNIHNPKDKVLLEQVSTIKDCVLKINREIIKKDNMNEVYDYILEKAIDFITNAHKGSILLYKEKEDVFVVHKSIGFKESKIKEIKLKPEETYFKNKKHMNKPYIIKNILEYNKANMDENNYNILEKSHGLHIKTTLSCPIFYKDNIYGILNVDSHEENVFNEDDKFLIKYFCEEISQAIHSFKLMEEKLYLVRYDSLTGLYNRDYFIKRLQEKKSHFSFIIIDLDKFKFINDTYGHMMGDEVLKIFAKKFKKTFGEEQILARYGGDEFVGIINIKDKNKLDEKINRLKNIFREPILIDDSYVKIEFSYGISFSFNNKNINNLFKTADRKMYKNKETKRKINQYKFI